MRSPAEIHRDVLAVYTEGIIDPGSDSSEELRILELDVGLGLKDYRTVAVVEQVFFRDIDIDTEGVAERHLAEAFRHAAEAHGPC